MRSTNAFSRRRFLASLGATSLAGAAGVSLAHPPAASGQGMSSSSQESSGYLLAPGLIHLNTASLGAMSQAVLDRTLAAWRMLEANPVRMAYGTKTDTVLAAADAARARAATFLGCDSSELMVTRCTTEGLNAVAQGIRWKPGDRVLTTDQEHEGGTYAWTYQGRRHGVAVDRIAIAPEEFDAMAILRRFRDAMTPRTRVISVSHVITSTGLRMPVAEIAALSRERGVLCVVDGAQAAGNIPVDVKALGCHAYATSGHKWLMGPKGTGLLYVSRVAWDEIAPIAWEEARADMPVHRYGAESAGVGPQPLVVGLGAAIERLQGMAMDEVLRHNLALRDRAEAGLRRVPGLRVVGPPTGPLAAAMVACVLPDHVDSVALRIRLMERYGLSVKSVEKRWFNGLRISPHVLNTGADIDTMLAAVRKEVG